MTDRIDRATRQDVYAWIDRRFDDFVEELRAYARVPTISARPEGEGAGGDATPAVPARRAPARERAGPPGARGEGPGVGVGVVGVPGGPRLVVGEVAGASAGPPLI